MAVNTVDAGREIAAAPEKVYGCIADYQTQRPAWLPPNFSNLSVEQGGVGDGTVVSYLLTVGNRARNYHMAVSEPEPGSVLAERDTNSSLVTTWTVSPRGTGSNVTVHTEWQGAGGIGGFFERLFAPAALKRVYDDALARLDRYATTGAAG